MKLRPLREPVRVVMHLPSGYTKVTLERCEGQGLADGSIEWDIPTSKIPIHLRTIGSRFIAVLNSVIPDQSDSMQALRSAAQQVSIEELPG